MGVVLGIAVEFAVVSGTLSVRTVKVVGVSVVVGVGGGCGWGLGCGGVG